MEDPQKVTKGHRTTLRGDFRGYYIFLGIASPAMGLQRKEDPSRGLRWKVDSHR